MTQTVRVMVQEFQWQCAVRSHCNWQVQQTDFTSFLSR